MNLQQIYDTFFPKHEFVKKSISRQTKHIYMFEYAKTTNANSRITNCLPQEDKLVTEDGRLWIKFSFKNIVMFGTNEQKHEFHRFRKIYVNRLLTSLCDKSKNCNFEIIWSDSPVSDMDITMYELLYIANQNNNTKAALKWMTSRTISGVIENIHSDHHKIFDQTLEELFDCNFFRTSFVYYSPVDISKKSEYTCIPNATQKNMFLCFIKHAEDYFDFEQRQWALSKFVKVLRIQIPRPLEIHFSYLFKKYYPKYDKILKLVDVFNLKSGFNTTISTTNTVASATRMSTNNTVREILSKTSKFSISEKDTYYTQGASFAHVVNRANYPDIINYLNANMLIDASLDNLGFIAEIIFSDDTCNDAFVKNSKMLKVSKYVDRICSNISLIVSKSDKKPPSDFSTIAKLSNQLNQKRKSLATINETRPLVGVFVEKLEEYANSCFLKKQGNLEDESSSLNLVFQLMKRDNTSISENFTLIHMFRNIVVFTFDNVELHDTAIYNESIV